jgi:hypothetical protein
MISTSEHYATVVEERDEIPVPSPQNQEIILDAWRQVLGQVLHARDCEWKEQLRAIKAESIAAVAELRAAAAEFRSTMERMVAERLAQIRDGKEGPRGEHGPRGEAGPPGRIEGVRAYVQDAVHYEGDIVVCEGSTYLATRDTGRAPPHEHWICLARAGMDGKDGRDGRSPNVRGTYRAGESYGVFDIVVLNGGSFIARRDDPGDCPGEGWQLMSVPGRRGQQGPRGERGPPGITAKSWKLDVPNYRLTLLLEGGLEGPTADLRPFYEQYDWEKGT